MAKQGGSKHLRRLAAPRTWKIKRKSVFGVWTIKPIPGPHPKEYSIPLGILVRDYLGLAKNMREARKIISRGEILIDLVPRKNYKFPVGILDTISIPKQDWYFRVIYDRLGRISLLEIKEEETKIKPLYVVRKGLVKGNRVQITTHDGRNFLFNREEHNKVYTGYSIVYNLESKEIIDIIERGVGVCAFLIRGAHRGAVGKIKEIRELPGMADNLVKVESLDGREFETIEDYVMPIGREEPVITIK